MPNPKQYLLSAIPVVMNRHPQGMRVMESTISITCSTSSMGRT